LEEDVICFEIKSARGALCH